MEEDEVEKEKEIEVGSPDWVTLKEMVDRLGWDPVDEALYRIADAEDDDDDEDDAEW